MMPQRVTLDAIAKRYGVALDGPCPIRLNAGRSDLPHLCRELGMRRGAEVGVWKGAYSEEFCRVLQPVDWFAVDPWAPYAAYREKKNDAVLIEQAYAEARERLDDYNVTFLRVGSLTAVGQVDEASLDVVYIDGNHEAAFVREDIEAWTRMLRPGGILAGHDYREPPASKPFIQVKAAVDAYVREQGIDPWFLLAGDKTPSFLWVV